MEPLRTPSLSTRWDDGSFFGSRHTVDRGHIVEGHKCKCKHFPGVSSRFIIMVGLRIETGKVPIDRKGHFTPVALFHQVDSNQFQHMDLDHRLKKKEAGSIAGGDAIAPDNSSMAGVVSMDSAGRMCEGTVQGRMVTGGTQEGSATLYLALHRARWPSLLAW